MASEELTTGRASAAKAILGATAASPGTSLLAAWEKYKKAQAGAQRLGKAGDAAADLEKRALKKSTKKLAKALRGGVAPSVACDRAHTHYRLLGGKSGHSVWARRVAGGD